MARLRRTGLRQLPSPPKKIKGLTNAERCKKYREDIQNDAERHAAKRLADMERCKKNYYRPRTEEELQMRREKERLRKQAYRNRQKATRAAEHHLSLTPSQPKTRKAVENQREKWRSDQQQARAKWTAQKWRRHREKCSRYYHGKKAEKETAVAPPISLRLTSSPAEAPQPQVEEPAELNDLLAPSVMSGVQHQVPEENGTGPSRTPEQFLTPKKQVSKQRTDPSPSPKTLKSAFKIKLKELKTKRSKKSLVARKILLDLISNDQVTQPENLYCKRKQSSATQAAVDFLHEISVDMPGKKSVSKKTLKQKKVLPTRMKRLHKDFVKKYPEHKISLRSFYRHLPANIVTSRRAVYNMCLCEICTNLDLKLDAINPYLKDPIDGRDVLSEKSLCKNPSTECYDRKCPNCGPSNLKEVLLESISPVANSIVKWRSWDMVATVNGKRRALISKESSLQVLLDALIKELHPFSRHLFNFRWQFLQFKTLLTALPESMAVAVCDFAENFVCKRQNEVQSAHWMQDQVTVHPTVLYYKCPKCSDTVTDYLVYLSDDLNHDSNMVKTIIDKTSEYVKTATKGQVQKMVIYSDGCAAQYKSKLPFFHLANSNNGIKIERCYFGSRHGKSACDACGGVIKRAVDDDIRAGVCILQNAADMHNHCCSHHVLPPTDELSEGCCHVKRSFHLITTNQIDRSRQSKSLVTVPGTRQIHSVKSMGRNILAKRNLACFCPPCLEDDANHCHNSEYVGPWDIVKLKFTESESETQVAPVSDSDAETSESRTAPNSEPDIPRDVFFRRLLTAFNKYKSFDELETAVRACLSDVGLYPLPYTQKHTVIDVGGTVDSTALHQRPNWVPSNCFPVQTRGDGNCLPRAASRLIFQTEVHHLELRCRIIIELTTNLSLYVQGIGMGDQQVTAQLAVVAENSGLTETMVTENNIRRMLMAEILQIRKPAVHMGLWQIAAFANIVNTPVMSVYPTKGWVKYQHLNNRLLQPRQQKTDHLLYIMWTSQRDDMQDDHWVPNHFVPLMPLVDDSKPVAMVEPLDALNDGYIEHPEETSTTAKVSDCFIALWDDKEYVARVDEVDAEHNLVLLNFMQFRRAESLYIWPTPEDTSWENVNVLREKVLIELVPSKSTHRIQLYKLCRKL